MPFDNTPVSRPRRERRRRVPISTIRLKAMIVHAALIGAISPAEAQDLLDYYGLRGE